MQSVTKPGKSNDSEYDSDSYDSDDSNDEKIVRDVMTETVRVLGTLNISHATFQNARRRRRVARRTARNPQNSFLDGAEEESARTISTKAYLENKPVTLGPRDGSVVYVRPFKEFIYNEGELRGHLAGLEKHFDDMNKVESTDGLTMTGTKVVADDGNLKEKLASSITAPLHLRCLMKFFDDEIKPKLEYVASDECRVILFHDLWHLYRPGDEVVDQAEKQAFRIIRVQSPRHWGKDLLEPQLNVRQSDYDPKDADNPLAMKVYCAYFDFNGKEFGPVEVMFNIPPFWRS
ncbi:P-loop containing nucleoside triphosphate hydrolase protein [Apiospora phragmitis]|uniref:P-loop containing nucleoside triphosphate hydrolase protein n=1 Tax=Apiospora phragmitis TaxID=2905665 RepID=A0ABR1U975_9PEZI